MWSKCVHKSDNTFKTYKEYKESNGKGYTDEPEKYKKKNSVPQFKLLVLYKF